MTNARNIADLGTDIVSDASNNVALGQDAADSTTGQGNVAVGRCALTANTTGNYNTALGNCAGATTVATSYNVFIGNEAGRLANGSGNTQLTYIGHNSGRNTTTANTNVGVGNQTLYANTTGSSNTAIGFNSLQANTTANNSVAIGNSAMYSNTTGQGVAVGPEALYANTTGTNNTAVGLNSMRQNSTGADNTAVGRGSLQNNTTATKNTAVGRNALITNTTGEYQTSIGYQAGYSRATNSYNTDVGALAGYTSSGQLNTFIGQQAGYSMTTGDGNTIIGRFNGNQGGLNILTSNNQIVLSAGDGNPYIWYNPAEGAKIRSAGTTCHNDYGVAGALVLSHNSGNTNGIVSSDVRSSGNSTHMYFMLRGSFAGYISSDTSSTSYNTSSDYRRKDNIVDLTGALDRVSCIPVRRFNFCDNPDRTVDGFVAHEVQPYVPEAIIGEKDAVNENGDPIYQVIDQSKLVPVMMAAIKELKAELDEAKARITALENA